MAWAECGGDDILSASDAMIEAEESIEESIRIFEKVTILANHINTNYSSNFNTKYTK